MIQFSYHILFSYSYYVITCISWFAPKNKQTKNHWSQFVNNLWNIPNDALPTIIVIMPPKEKTSVRVLPCSRRIADQHDCEKTDKTKNAKSFTGKTLLVTMARWSTHLLPYRWDHVMLVFFFCACKDLGRMFNNLFPACIFFFFFFKVEISLRKLIPLFRPGSVYNGSASWDDCNQVFPDELHVSLFPDRFPHSAWTVV